MRRRKKTTAVCYKFKPLHSRNRILELHKSSSVYSVEWRGGWAVTI